MNSQRTASEQRSDNERTPSEQQADTRKEGKEEEEFEEGEISEDELNQSFIKGQRVLKSFYFDYKSANYIDDEKKVLLLLQTLKGRPTFTLNV